MSTDDLAEQIVARCRERLERGETVDPEAVIRAHPDMADALRVRFDALRLLERAFARGGASRVTDAPSLAGRSLGPFRLESTLGAGGMGTVYAATVEGPSPGLDVGTRVAVKVIHPHLLAREGSFQRFAREAEIGRSVRHENVVATLAADEVVDASGTSRFLVMEYVEGRTLRDLLADLTRVPEELCRHVGREVAKALAAIHAAGAVHRDVKPDNVIVTPDNVVKVMDLGVARIEGDAVRVSQTGAFVGSVRYAAPEQFGLRSSVGAEEATPRSPVRAEGGPRNAIDGRADLYALGLTLYELATGKHPFDDDDFAVVMRRQMDDVPRPAGELNPQLSPFFEEVLARLVEKDRDRRIASAADLARILEEGEESAWWRERSQSIRTATHRPLRRIRIPRETALYGRDAELALLRSLYQRASEGDGQVAVVEGEAGIGKSRLVDEFVGLLAQAGEDVNFLYGSYPPGGAATAAGAFTSAYREHLGDDESAVRAALPQTPLLASAFAALLRGDVAPDDAEKLTKDSLQTVFVHATRSFAAQRTTIVLIDDLHFAPEEGRALFASLALAVPGHRILLVGTARPEIDTKWLAQVGRAEDVSRIAVPRLGAKDLVLLLRDSLHSEHLAEELAGKIATKSDGNPFFVFEILRGLRDGQFLTRKPDGTWATTKLIAEIEVPGSVKDLIFARVGSLTTEARNLLDVAACAGFEFDPVLVGEVLHVGRIPVLQRLAAVEKSHRLVHSSGRRFVFDHHQVAEVLYAGLPEILREEYHAAIGAAIESRTGAARKEPSSLDGAVCVDLAEHFLKGGQGDRAIRYLDAALTHLEKGYLHDAAIRLADHALAAPGLLADEPRCELLLRKCHRLYFLGRSDEEAKALEEAMSLADASGDSTLRIRARTMSAGHLIDSSKLDAAQRAFEEALALSRASGDRKGEAAVLRGLGSALSAVGRFAEAQTQFERSIALARETCDRREEAASTVGLGIVFQRLGRYADAQTQYERHLAFAPSAGDRAAEAGTLVNLGFVFQSLGRFAEGQANFERAIALCRTIGHRRFETNATGRLACGLLSLGRHAEAQTQIERQLALAREIGSRDNEAGAIGSLANVLFALGRLAEAQTQIKLQLAIAREMGDPMMETIALVNLGWNWLVLGDLRLAQEALEASLSISRTIGTRYPEGYALQTLGTVADEQGDTVRATTFVEEALALRRKIGHMDGVAISLLALGDLRRRGGDVVGARAAFEEAGSLARGQGMKGEAALALAFLACLPGGDVEAAEAAFFQTAEFEHSLRIRLLLWTATRDRAHLAEAKRLLDELLAKNPPEHHAAMLANVRLYREIAVAAREQGLPLAADSADA